LTSKAIYSRLDEENAYRLWRELKENPHYYTILLNYIPMLMNGERSLQEILDMVEIEYGPINMKTLEWFIETLKTIGFIEMRKEK